MGLDLGRLIGKGLRWITGQAEQEAEKEIERQIEQRQGAGGQPGSPIPRQPGQGSGPGSFGPPSGS